MSNADVDGDGCVDAYDWNYLVEYLTGPGPAPVTCTKVLICGTPVCDSCPHQKIGDTDGDGDIDIGDATYLGSYIQGMGQRPVVWANGDFDGDCDVDKDDFNDLVSFLFSGSPLPVACTCIRPKTLTPSPAMPTTRVT